MTQETDPTDRGRIEVSNTVKIGSFDSLRGGRNVISGDVEITISGAAVERHDVTDLQKEIEDAVVETVRNFEASEYEENR
jgi:hypothetical protein